MKKILAILTMALMVILVGCSNSTESPQTYTQAEVDAMLQNLEDKIDTLRITYENDQDNVYTSQEIDLLLQAIEDNTYSVEEIDTMIQIVNTALDLIYQDISNAEGDIGELEQILINLGVIEGLNGQQEWYITDAHNPLNVLAYETLGDELDKSKSPTYILDENQEYIEYQTLVNLLCEKYYGLEYEIIQYQLGSMVGFNMMSTLTIDEWMARTILLIEELSNYDWYIIGSSQLYIQVNSYGGTSWIKIPMQSLRSDFITWNASLFINGLYEVELVNLPYNETNVQALYDSYVLNETFTGYVLNY